jgi:glycine C-acetyltransferase
MASWNADGQTNASGLLDGVCDIVEADGPDLLRRWDRHHVFWDARLAAGLDPTVRVILARPGPEGQATDRAGTRIDGVNFASHDHLSLVSHPGLCDAVAETIERYGVHGGGPISGLGATLPLILLEERVAEFLSCRSATVFPTGWAAGYGAVRVLVSPSDHVVMDSLVHDALREAAAAATRNLHRVPHVDTDAFARRLAAIRSRHRTAGILAITDSTFAIDGAVPNLRLLRDACRAHGATLLVWLAHDLGATGDGGLGAIGDAGLAGEVDVLVGSFASVFASTGGFVATDAPGLKQALSLHAPTLAGSCALSPVQAATALAALEIVRSAEGARRRRRLASNIGRLRDGLASRAFDVIGPPGAMVPVLLGDLGTARAMTRAAQYGGALIDLIEHPFVSRGASRWPLRVMADHRDEHIDRLVEIAVAAREAAATKPDHADREQRR